MTKKERFYDLITKVYTNYGELTIEDVMRVYDTINVDKKYTHSLSNGLVISLKKFAETYMDYERPVHLRDDVGLTHNELCNFQKLKYFGLVEKSVDSKGCWSLTQCGTFFLSGLTPVPEKVITQGGKVVREIGGIYIGQFPDKKQPMWQEEF